MARFYVPLDVNYQLDDKIICAGPLAECMYVRSLAFSKRGQTEGRIRHAQLRVIGAGIRNAPLHARTLVEYGLWEADGDGWYITGWLNHNLTNAGIIEEKARKRALSMAGNHKRHHVAKGIIDDDCELCNPPATGQQTLPQSSRTGEITLARETEAEEKRTRKEVEEKRKEPSSSSSELQAPVDNVEEDEDRKLIDDAMDVVVMRLVRKGNPQDAFSYEQTIRRDERHRRDHLATLHKRNPHFTAQHLADQHLGRDARFIEAEIYAQNNPVPMEEPRPAYEPEPYIEPAKCPGCKYPQTFIDLRGCMFKRKPGHDEPANCFQKPATVTPIRQEPA